MKKWIVVLGLGKLNVSELINKALFIVDSMMGNPYFPSPPPLGAVNAAAHALQNAFVAAEDGSREDTAFMHTKRYELEQLLTALGAYVQGVANEDPEIGDVIIFSAGMDVKNTVGAVSRAFRVFNTELEGRVRIRTGSQGSRSSYRWEYSVDQENWTEAGETLQASTVISGLTPGTRYYFRVRALTKEGPGPWQGPIHLIVT